MIQEEKQELMLATAKDTYGNGIKVVSAEKNVLHFMTADKSITYTCHNNGKIDESVRWRRGHKPADTEITIKNTPVSKSTADMNKAADTVEEGQTDSEGYTYNVNGHKKHFDGMHQLTFEDILGSSTHSDNDLPSADTPAHTESCQTVSEKKKAPSEDKKLAATETPTDAEEGFMNPPVDDTHTDEDRPLSKEIKDLTDAVLKIHTGHKAEPDKSAHHRPDKSKNDKVKGETEKKDVKTATADSTGKEESEDADPVVFMHETPCPFVRGESVESVYSGKAYTVLSVLGNTTRVVTSDTKTERMEFTICASDLKPSTKKARILDERTDV